MQKRKKEKQGTQPGPAPALGDDRFAVVQSDPRFARFPKARRASHWAACPYATCGCPTRWLVAMQSKAWCVSQAKGRVDIDDRFKGMFGDARFRQTTTVDKRGKRKKGCGAPVPRTPKKSLTACVLLT